jgi:DNA-directed RNA polymerase subunit RPC12/RpoP
MSFWKKLFALKCATCGTTVDTSRYASGLDLAETMGKTAYKCRACGALVCLDCAQSIPCKKCGGKVFDIAVR